MKRAKIMLVAIAILATVGGALAFKAQKFTQTKYCTNTSTTAVCSILTDLITTDVSPVKPAIFTVYYTTTYGVQCPTFNFKCTSISTSFAQE